VAFCLLSEVRSSLENVHGPVKLNIVWWVFGGVLMFFIVAAALVLASFLLMFGLWFIIWSFTMSSSETVNALAENRLSDLQDRLSDVR
jgi:hypothetical protein